MEFLFSPNFLTWIPSASTGLVKVEAGIRKIISDDADGGLEVHCHPTCAVSATANVATATRDAISAGAGVISAKADAAFAGAGVAFASAVVALVAAEAASAKAGVASVVADEAFATTDVAFAKAGVVSAGADAAFAKAYAASAGAKMASAQAKTSKDAVFAASAKGKKPVRAGIHVDYGYKTNLAPFRSDITVTARKGWPSVRTMPPRRGWVRFDLGFYKYAAPMALGQRVAARGARGWAMTKIQIQEGRDENSPKRKFAL